MQPCLRSQERTTRASWQTQSTKGWTKHSSCLQVNFFLPVKEFVICVLPTPVTHFPLPNPALPDTQGGCSIFPGTRTWDTLSTNFTQASWGVQRDNLEVQGKKAVSGEVGGPSKVKKVGAHSSSAEDTGGEPGTGRCAHLLGGAGVATQMNRCQGSLGPHAATEKVQVAWKGISRERMDRRQMLTRGSEERARGMGLSKSWQVGLEGLHLLNP